VNRARPRGGLGRRVIGGVAVAGLLSATMTTAAARAASGAARRAPFVDRASTVTAAELGGTWHAGCPVGPSSLRAVELSYVGFDDRVHLGTIVVNEAVVPEVVKAFRLLYLASFPIRGMRPEAAFGGSDPRSMAADNTSGFNCRLAVATGPPAWSVHAYGEAIDVNPVENPYLYEGRADPPAGEPFLRRTPARPGMAVAGGTLVAAFSSVGWFWGGRWSSSPDYQHFSATGG